MQIVDLASTSIRIWCSHKFTTEFGFTFSTVHLRHIRTLCTSFAL